MKLISGQVGIIANLVCINQSTLPMKNITRFLCITLVSSFIFSLTISKAATITSISTGNWYAASTWDCACVPGATDDVIIEAFHTVTLSDVASVGSVVLNTSGTLALSDNTDVLTISGDFTINAAAACSIGGTIIVGNNLTNAGTLSGASGAICIAMISTNTGAIVGTLDFCDATPPPNTPFIDNNTGTVNPGFVTYCTTGACTGTGIAEANIQFSMDVYPNPAHDYVTVKIEAPLSPAVTLVLHDMLGQEVSRVSGNSNERIVIERNQLPDGLYFISLYQKGQAIVSSKLLLE